MTPPRVYLIRHGETAWSLSGQHTGRSDIPLTARGEEKARELRPVLAAISFAQVWASPRMRAQKTCELAGLGAAMVVKEGLSEWDYGDFEGLTSAEIRQRRPDWNLFRDGSPGGESPAQVSARADGIAAELRKCEGNVALFSHGHFLRVLGSRWISLPVLDAQRFLLDTASVSVLTFEHGSFAEPVIGLWNSTAR